MKLEAQVDSAIRTFHTSVFIRLSTRSPKDATDFISTDTFLRDYDTFFSEACRGDPESAPPHDINASMTAFFRASMKATRVESGRQALQLLLSRSVL